MASVPKITKEELDKATIYFNQHFGDDIVTILKVSDEKEGKYTLRREERNYIDPNHKKRHHRPTNFYLRLDKVSGGYEEKGYDMYVDLFKGCNKDVKLYLYFYSYIIANNNNRSTPCKWDWLSTSYESYVNEFLAILSKYNIEL